MKFLCVDCDAKMNLRETIKHEDSGSLSVVFSCTSCGRETAMLTNPGETQLVSSLGIKIGGESDDKPKCPFSTMLGGSTEAEPVAADGVSWSADAQGRLENIPEFVRPMAKMGIEKFAKDNGFQEINLDVLDQAKDLFGM